MESENCIKFLLLEGYYALFPIGLIIVFPVLVLMGIILKLLKFIQNGKGNKSIRGQVAVITGSARGLGRILAIELAKRGCHVAIVDILEVLAEETALHISQKYQVKAKSYKVDVTDYQQLEELNKNVTQDLGDVTILINNAAMLTFKSMEHPTADEIQRMISVNFTGVCFTQRIFLPKMKALNRGHIVNICSVLSLATSPICNIYAGTKSAVRSITSALRMEIRNEAKNITATTVMPMFMNTNQRVERLANKSGITKVFPVVEGPLAAQYVLKSMFNNEEEVTIPKTMLYMYKLMELSLIKLFI